jgi:hypothetical protein
LFYFFFLQKSSWSQAVFCGAAIVLYEYITVDCATAASQNGFSEYKLFIQEDQYNSKNGKKH